MFTKIGNSFQQYVSYYVVYLFRIKYKILNK